MRQVYVTWVPELCDRYMCYLGVGTVEQVQVLPECWKCGNCQTGASVTWMLEIWNCEIDKSTWVLELCDRCKCYLGVGTV